ncbi:MAG: response regulator [bacterium]|nr:response regulator [bacterium]
MNKDGKNVVLLVDDDANLREIIKAKLEAGGFVVIEAKDGEDGVNKAKNNKPDLILMDVQMPKMNGIEALSKIKADPDTSQAKVLFLTNYGEANTSDAPLDDKFARDIGAIGHLRKTDDLDKIIERVKQELFKITPNP